MSPCEYNDLCHPHNGFGVSAGGYAFQNSWQTHKSCQNRQYLFQTVAKNITNTSVQKFDDSPVPSDCPSFDTKLLLKH